jgi:OmpA family
MNRCHFWIRCLLVVAATVGMTVLCWARQEQWTFYFAHNSATMAVNGEGTPRGNHNDELNTLDEVGLQMKHYPDARAQITGYAQPDEKDPPRLIGALAELRAERVKGYLVTRQGIDPARITTAGEKSSTRGPCAVITLRQE